MEPFETLADQSPNGLPDNDHNFSIDAFSADIKKNLRETDLFSEDQITEETDAEIIPIINIGESIFAVKGDISIVGGLPKVGKTSVCAYMIATAFMQDIPEDLDCLQIRTAPCWSKEVVYIDTEQPKAYTKKLLRMVMKIMGTNAQPSNLKVYNFRKYDCNAKLDKVINLMDHFPDAHLWIIDGVADLIRDPNNTTEAFNVIETFMIKCNALNTTAVLYIHENPGSSGKLRGNLGSEAERKCGGAITIKRNKEKGFHYIEPRLIRGSEDFETIYFHFDKTAGLMVSLNETEAREARQVVDRKEKKARLRVDLARKCLLAGGQKYMDLVRLIIQHSSAVESRSFSKRTAESRIQDMKAQGIIQQNGEFYHLVDTYITQP